MKVLLVVHTKKEKHPVEQLLVKNYPEVELKAVHARNSFASALLHFKPEVILLDSVGSDLTFVSAIRLAKKMVPVAGVLAIIDGPSFHAARKLLKAGADDIGIRGEWRSLISRLIKIYGEVEKKLTVAGALEQNKRNRQVITDLVDLSKEGVMAVAFDWRIIYVNKGAERLLRMKRKEVLGLSLWQVFSKSTHRDFVEKLVKAMDDRKSYRVDEYVERLQKWVQAFIYTTKFGLGIFFHDITFQRAAETKAQKSEARYRTFLERITDGFIALDKDFRYTYANKKAGELTHRSPESLIGKNVWEEFPDAVDSFTYKAFQTAMKEQRFISNVDYYAPLQLWQENYMYPSQEGLSVFIRDISERKKLEQKLAEQERLQQLQIVATSLEAQEKERTHIGQELHDNVNQILVATKLMLSLIRDDQEYFLPMLEKCILNLDEVIRENRKLAHELVTPDLVRQSLVEQLTFLFQSMLGPNHIEVLIEAERLDESLINADQKLASYRIAQEQCTNIIKHASANKVLMVLEIKDNTFVMVINDNGRGMAKEEAGRGIGFKNMEGRLRLFDGTLHIESEPGKGFSLQISMPVLWQPFV